MLWNKLPNGLVFSSSLTFRAIFDIISRQPHENHLRLCKMCIIFSNTPSGTFPLNCPITQLQDHTFMTYQLFDIAFCIYVSLVARACKTLFLLCANTRLKFTNVCSTVRTKDSLLAYAKIFKWALYESQQKLFELSHSLCSESDFWIRNFNF